jgi:hypothetical protein
LEGHNLLATDFPFAFFSSIDSLRASLRRALANSFWSYALNPLSSSTFFSSGGGGLRFPACASGCPSTPNIVPEAVAATNHLQHNVPNTFLHESRSNVSNCIERLGKYSMKLKIFTWNCRSFAGVYTHVQDCKSKGTERYPMGDLAERNTDYVRLLELEIIYRKRLGTYKRRISGTTYVILYTNQDIDRKRGKKPTYERHQKQLLGIGCLPADIQAVDKPWSRGWVCIQPNLYCGIHTVLIAKQWSKRIQKLPSPLLPLQVS